MNSQQLNILLVDDDADTRLLTERFLQSVPAKVATAGSGAEGLACCHRSQPDLILLDVMMPDMNGYQVCAQLQRDPVTALIPVVFLTALNEEQDKARALAAGAADYLTKPVSRERLLETVRKHSDTKQRWYNVRIATDLWDEAPLPQKFAQFRDVLISRVDPGPNVVRQAQALRSHEVYRLGELLDLTHDELAERMAAFFGLEYVSRIDTQSIQLGVLPTSFCRANYVVAIKDARDQDAVVICNPFAWDLDQLDALNRAFRGRPYRLLIAKEGTVGSLFLDGGGKKEQSESTAASVEVTPEETLSVERLLVAGMEPTAVEIVNALIADATRKGASDVHIEPARGNVRVRYRVDGQMRPIMPIQRSLMPNIAARIKVMCNMDLSETRRPQDGNCSVKVSGEEVELRASTLPGINGEIIVLRLLSRNTGALAMKDLGLNDRLHKTLRSLLTARQGMLLVTGPTGSGKTTTLYAALHHLNREDVNIVTVEDPVEVDLDGINQVQVHDRAGRSFATTLRAMLRQDPDVLMIGEIRDAETAEIACRAALTGHLVLSTMHTQHTLGTLARLFDIGIPPYLVACSLNGILAQRLVRRVCEGCAETYQLPANIRQVFESHFGSLAHLSFRRGTGCSRCGRTGTRGRIGVHELLVIDDDLRRLMSEGAAPSDLRKYVRSHGFETMEVDAFRKAAAGLIPPEEVVRLGFTVASALEELDTSQ